MNREIKFRVWETHSRTMHYDANDGYQIWLNGALSQGGSWLSHKSSILMQFTGKKDKNGKEIYEGDVLRQEAYSDAIFIFKECTQVIEDIRDILFEKFTYEVIGNVYENPELLEKKKYD